MGAWPSLWGKFGAELFERMPYSSVTRPESASPATGSASAHRLEQEYLLTEAFGGDGEELDLEEQRQAVRS